MKRSELTFILLFLMLMILWMGDNWRNSDALVDSLRCEEDQYLIGKGQFEKGIWTEYECQNPEMPEIPKMPETLGEN